MIPKSLYIHIPWCVQKCPYCDFNSHQAPESLPETALIDKLLVDLESDLTCWPTDQIFSIFIGGGTPSLLSADSISRLLAGIRNRVNISSVAEITMEANPGKVDQSHFAGYRQAGINRISIGAQTFDAAILKTLGRIHSPDQIERAFDIAGLAGIARINLDLMHGLPGQTIKCAVDDLKQAIAMAPEHLSWYQLTIEPNTAFYNQPPALPADDIMDEIQQQGSEILEQAGYQQYEISAWAKPGRESQHNLNYWQFGDYYGIGPGAHGKHTVDREIIRTRKTRMPDHYLNAITPLTSQVKVAKNEVVAEFMMNALRLRTGVDLELMTSRTGLTIADLGSRWQQLVTQGLVVNDRIMTTELGYRFLNRVLAEFLD